MSLNIRQGKIKGAIFSLSDINSAFEKKTTAFHLEFELIAEGKYCGNNRGLGIKYVQSLKKCSLLCQNHPYFAYSIRGRKGAECSPAGCNCVCFTNEKCEMREWKIVNLYKTKKINEEQKKVSDDIQAGDSKATHFLC